MSAALKILSDARPEQIEACRKLLQFCAMGGSGQITIHVDHQGMPRKIEYSHSEQIVVAKTP